MSGRNRGLVTGCVVASALLMAAGVAATIATPGRLQGGDASAGWSTLAFVVPVAAFSIVGGLLAVRRPENAVGWLLAAIGLLWAIVLASSAVPAWALRTGDLPQAVGEWTSVGSTGWVVALGLLGTQLPLRIPDGRLPSPRWKWYSRVSIVLIAVSVVGMTATPGRVEDVPGTSNPLATESLEPLSVAFLGVIICFVGGIAALAVRYRRANGHDRAQLRWVVFGGGVFLVVYLVMLAGVGVLEQESTAGTAMTSFGLMAFAALPISIGYAILRHRLYDIDVIINRALVYGALTATLTAAYAGSVLLLQLVMNGLTGDSGLAVAASTLGVAALFRPARGRIQQTVDRRFFRRKYDAQRTLEAFGGRLRDQLDLDALSAELREVVADTMQPAHVSLWVPPPQVRR